MTACDATITLAEAAAICWDVVIIGAGPAGSSAALRLARLGLRTLLIDRAAMPRGKICGCCLSPAAVEELERLAITAGGGPLARAVPLRRVNVAAGGCIASIDVTGGATLSRESLDTYLVAAALAAGCQWLPRTTAISIDERQDGIEPLAGVFVREAVDSPPTRIECRRLLLATGLGDHVRLPSVQTRRLARTIAPRSRIGIGAVLPADAASLASGELLMAVAANGYCGLVRLEDGRIDVAAAVDRRSLSIDNPATVLRRILREACGPEAVDSSLTALDTALIRATPALTRSAPLTAGAGRTIMQIGDAAGYVEPFTGEGMGWALAAGRLAAESIGDPDGRRVKPAAEATPHFVRAHARHFASRHARCRRVAAALRRPRLVTLAVRLARMAPWAARLTVPAIIGGRQAVRRRNFLAAGGVS